MDRYQKRNIKKAKEVGNRGSISLDRESIIWFSSLFDGEGHLSKSKSGSGSGNGAFLIGITNSDHDLIERLRVLFGGSVYEKTGNRNKICYEWRINQSRAYPILTASYPFLSNRRKEQVRNFVEFFKDQGFSTRLIGIEDNRTPITGTL